MRIKALPKFLLCPLLFLITAKSFSQVDFASHFHYEIPGKIIGIGNNLFFTSEVYTEGYFDSCLIYSVSKSGAIRFGKILIKNEYTTVTDLVPLKDHTLLLTGFASPCDYLDSSQLNFILKLDTSGNIVFNKNFQNLNYLQNDAVRNIFEFPDSTLIGVTDSLLFHFDYNGNLLSKKRLPFENIKCAGSPGNDRLVFSSSTAGGMLFLADTSGNVLKMDTAGVVFTKIQSGRPGMFFALGTDKKVYAIDSSFAIAGNSSAAQGTGSAFDFFSEGDSVFIGINSATGSLARMKTDDAFNFLNADTIPYPEISGQGLCYDSASIYFLNLNDASANHNKGINVLQADRNGGFVPCPNDVTLSQVAVDTSYVVFTYNGSVTYVTYYFRIKATIANAGSVPVTEVNLNHNYIQPVICGPGFRNINYSGIFIPPGQSLVLTTPMIADFATQPIFGPPPSGQGSFSLGNQCFWTSIPNKKIDRDNSNNEKCISFSIAYTGINDLNTDPHCTLFPNPAGPFACLSFGAPADENIDLLLTDMNGRQVYSTMIPAGAADFKLSTSFLNAGVYTVLLRRNGSSKALRLVKISGP